MDFGSAKNLYKFMCFVWLKACVELSGFNVKPSEAMTVELWAGKAGCSLAAGWGRLLGASWLERIVNVSYDSRDPFMHNYTNSLNSQGHQRLHSHLF